MAMETRLSLRQSQRVVMTPLLQQAIQLLQLSTLELQEVVQKELLENPLLEEVAPETENAPEAAAASPEAPPATTTPAEPPPVDASTSTTERQTDDLPFDLTAVMFDDHEERSLFAQEDREELPFENIVRSVYSLAEHLDEQLRGAVGDQMLLGERRVARDEDRELHDPPDVRQLAGGRLQLGEDVHRARARAALSRVNWHPAAELAGRDQLAALERELPGDVDEITGAHPGHVRGGRRRGFRQVDPERGEARLRGGARRSVLPRRRGHRCHRQLAFRLPSRICLRSLSE